MLLQHGGYGDRSGPVAGRRLHGEDRGLDGIAKEDENLRIGVVAAVFVGVQREDYSSGAPVEPARAGRR